ncbi:MAG: alpha/beta hydrolase [Candidatus Acidiferrales bacterium]
MMHLAPKVPITFAWLIAVAMLVPQGRAQTAAAAPSGASADTRSVVLWPNGAPGALTGGGELDVPKLDIYLPATNPTKTGVIICPGGGHQHLSLQKEGSDVAAWLNARGVAGFVLHYRLGPRYHYPAPFEDVTRAMRYVRANAAALGIDPKHIGVMGFSAGGSLASIISTHYDAGSPDSTDPIEKLSSRPDFSILCYAVISMHEEITHASSRLNLLGPNPDLKLVNLLSSEDHVTADTPPAFLYHTASDQTVPVINSVLYFEALKKAGVPGELHIFESGPHGTGLGQNIPGLPALAEWPTLLANWMRANGWMETDTTAAPATGVKP